ncbi:MAG: radical SAM protein [Elusimicrobiota bacterium]|nr:radical SAM protein [Elusimicrobiota bacterium]
MLRKLRSTLGPAYAWGSTLLNYWLFRLSSVLPFKVRAWPHELYVEGTNICNAACVFCAYPQMVRPKKVMPMDLFEKVVVQYAAMGGGDVDVTPIVGDPFADAKLFERLDRLQAEPKVRRVSFFTNAIAMKPALGDRLLAYGGKLTVHISYGGFDKATYAKVMGVDKFDEVWPNLRHLIAAKRKTGSALGIQVNLRTPAGNNEGPLYDELVAARDEGLVGLTWMGAYDSWSGAIKDEDLRAAGLAPRPRPEKNGPCHRLLTTPVVLADGRVNACGCRDTEATLIIGDLRDNTLEEILSGRPLRDLLDAHARGDWPEACVRCTYYDSVYPRWWPGQKAPADPSVPVK